MSKDPTWISDWRPEDETFWNSTGKVVARRNLIWSIVAEHLGIFGLADLEHRRNQIAGGRLPLHTDQLFQLVAVPGLIGSLMRFPYTFAVTTFGGRNWTIFSTSVLFIPTLALAYFVSHPETPFWLMLLVASTAGLGGGNFASSMTNISFFYPGPHEGLGARPERGRRQYRRQQRAIADANPDGRRPDQPLPGNARRRASIFRTPD